MDKQSLRYEKNRKLSFARFINFYNAVQPHTVIR